MMDEQLERTLDLRPIYISALIGVAAVIIWRRLPADKKTALLHRAGLHHLERRDEPEPSPTPSTNGQKMCERCGIHAAGPYPAICEPAYCEDCYAAVLAEQAAP